MAEGYVKVPRYIKELAKDELESYKTNIYMKPYITEATEYVEKYITALERGLISRHEAVQKIIEVDSYITSVINGEK